MTNKLRFAPLIRVSTEAQERQGESLRTQKARIIATVESLGGIIPDSCWKYSGQEHATGDFERKKFDQLLQDCEKCLFDAVIVDDPSRWSRDNVKSGQGLEILKRYGIRFFSGSVEHDLFDPTAEMYLNVSTAMNQYFAKIQNLKSARNRISRLKRGIPSVGKIPFGRIWNKSTQSWTVDELKKKRIEHAADRYIAGDSLTDIADSMGRTTSNLHKILTEQSGDKWIVRFKIPKFNIDEEIEISVPRLLPEEKIQAIKKKAQAKKTFEHGKIKNQYLISRMVFCSQCGLALAATTNRNASQNQYYRHAWCKSGDGFYVPGKQLEETVLLQVFSMLGDVDGMSQAMFRAIPNADKIKELRERKSLLESELKKIDLGKQRIVSAIVKGIISDDDAKKEMDNIRNQAERMETEIRGIAGQLENLPTEQQIKTNAALIKRMIAGYYDSPQRLWRMSFDEKKKLLQIAFGAKDTQGRRLGVYVDKGDRKGHFRYEIRGVFGDALQGILSKGGITPYDFRDSSIEYAENLIGFQNIPKSFSPVPGGSLSEGIGPLYPFESLAG